MGKRYTVQGPRGRNKTPKHIPLHQRAAKGVSRRVRERVLPSDRRLRRIPFGLAKGISIETSLYPSAHRYFGVFEYEIASYVRELCRSGTRCWDVGGQDGYYALIFAKLTGEPVISFEALEDRCERLRDVSRANPDLNRLVDVRHAFIGDSSGTGEISLDSLRGELGAPDVVKIDIEGGEADALRGAKELMHEEHPSFVIETHSARLEGECTDLLLDAGYLPIVVGQRRWFRETRPCILNRWLVAKGQTISASAPPPAAVNS